MLLLISTLALYGCSSGSGTPEEEDCGGTLSSIPGQPSECTITSINGDFTFTNNLVWKISSPITIGSATTSATLTIEEGAVIEMEPTSYIHVLAGSNIDAVGTADRPIQIKSIAPSAPSAPGGGAWGGVFIEDSLANDVENRIQYVIISDAGAATPLDLGGGPTFYSSGLTLFGDHANTTLRFINIHDSEGDAITLHGLDSMNQNMARMDWPLI